MIFSCFILLLFCHTIFGLAKFNQSECGNIKSCLRWSSCTLPNCDFGQSWRMIKINSTKYLEIELVGHMANSINGYIAMGFSLDKLMMDNGVVTCRMLDSQMFISSGYNHNHDNHLFNETELDPDFLVINDGDKYGIEFDASSQQLRCRFLRLMTPTQNIETLKNLDNGQQYYIFSGKGVPNTPSRLSYHSKNRRISPTKYDLTSSHRVNYIISVGYTYIKVHACCMIIGWVFFATNGIGIASYYKKKWLADSGFGDTAWFNIHRALQMSCIACVITGFVVIFVYVGGYSYMNSLPNKAHPVLGIIATCLLLVNPIIALFRCKPNSDSRWIFNWIHFSVGFSAYFFALVTMAIGIQLPTAGPTLDTLMWPWMCVVMFIVTMVIGFAVRLLKKCRSNKVEDRKDLSILSPQIEDIREDRTLSAQSTSISVLRYILEWTSVSVFVTVLLMVFVIMC